MSRQYILHPLEAAAIVATITDDKNVIAAAVLHDVVED
jgi:GTP diphosphokinase / guanosine-3',5'-bis(diphosphate) 3'-diphosphatase